MRTTSGETLRSILLNAYGLVDGGDDRLYVGIALIVAGIVLAIFAVLGFRHARPDGGRRADSRGRVIGGRRRVG